MSAAARMPFDNSTVALVVYAIGSPALVFNSLASIDIDLAAVGEVMAACDAVLVATPPPAALLLGVLGLDRRVPCPR